METQEGSGGITQSEPINNRMLRFRYLQERGAEYAAASGISLEDIPGMLRETRQSITPAEVEEAHQKVEQYLNHRG